MLNRFVSRGASALVVSAMICSSAVIVFPTASFADSGTTEGGSGGGASTGGAGGRSWGGFGTQTRSDVSTSRHSANSVTKTTFSVSAGTKSRGAVNAVSLHTTAIAGASSSRHSIKAYASASADGKSIAKDDGALAVAGSGGDSAAAAESNGFKSTAEAESSAGGYAKAVAGRNATTEASVPDGNETSKTIGRMSITIAWNADGTFAIAEVRGNVAHALTGSTTDTGALADGDLRAILSTATYAEAYASPTFASALAYSSAWGGSFSAAGYAVAGANSYAYASVTHPIEAAPSSKCMTVDYRKTVDFKKNLKPLMVWDCHYQPYVGVVWHPKGKTH